MPDYSGLLGGQYQPRPNIPNLLDTDPGEIRNPYYQDQYAKLAALKGLELSNQRQEQVTNLQDPAQRRLNTGLDTNYAVGLSGNEGGALDKYQGGLAALNKLLLGRSQNTVDTEKAQAMIPIDTEHTRAIGGVQNDLVDQRNRQQVSLEDTPFVQDLKNKDTARQIAIDDAKYGAVHGAPKFNSQEQNTLDATNDAGLLGNTIMQRMQQSYPGIDKDTGQYGSLLDALNSRVGKVIYSAGATAHDEDIMQFTGKVEAALARALAGGRVNQAQYDDIKAHLPQIGFSPGANYERIRNLMTTILPTQVQAMGMSHKPMDPNNPLANTPFAQGTAQTDPLGIR